MRDTGRFRQRSESSENRSEQDRGTDKFRQKQSNGLDPVDRKELANE